MVSIPYFGLLAICDLEHPANRICSGNIAVARTMVGELAEQAAFSLFGFCGALGYISRLKLLFTIQLPALDHS